MCPRRLLVVIDEMEVGGSQRQIVHLLTGIDREQWQPELAYFRNDSFLTTRLRDAGIPVHHLPKRGRIDARFLRDFGRLLRSGNYDLIHAFSLTAELWAVLARMISGKMPPLVASERNQQLHQPAWYWRVKQFVLARSAGVIANSEAGAETTARRTRLPRSLFDMIPNGVPIPPPIPNRERLAIRAELGVPDGRMFGLFVGRMVPQKNLDCLIRALALVASADRPWMALAGDGPLRPDVERLATGCGLERDLVFLGERNDATRLMQAADFLVLPSHFEGLSNSLLEAMAAGCPVVASAVGGNRELIQDDRTGLLFPADDAPALAVCLARVGGDCALRARLSRDGRDHVVRHHGVPAMVSATTCVYGRCIEQGAMQPPRHDTQVLGFFPSIARIRRKPRQVPMRSVRND